ncbi:hypothetical protein LGK95_20545 [Clostridium algoriphilum]|uniref:hypothetical protein n=1 Tax=Clostridium algoriphilum TaxID=198347 RepID=UPI001CF5376D|nr:hypothetical protein [Clostridium algoriphilum]MCB2295855.1 hypothetical protein [Clostridium algoriphilum]
MLITIVLAIGIGLINYESIFSAYYFSQANRPGNFDKKTILFQRSINYKVSKANSKAFASLILSESKINSVKAENVLISNRNLLNDDVFKNSYFDVQSGKANSLIINHKYKEAAEAYATCSKYGISIVNNNNTEYINALSKYAKSLVDTTNLNAEDTSHYYTVGDLDNDGLLEIVVFEKKLSFSSGIYTSNNIKLFKCVNSKYSLIGSLKSEAEYCINIKISKAKDNIDGVFVSGGIGAHSGIQSLYIIKDGKLVSALEEDIKSLYPSDIKDVDGDKRVELSSLETDPNDMNSSNADSDKIVTWFKWDGKSGLNAVKIEQLTQ